jgi:hypothetical protein
MASVLPQTEFPGIALITGAGGTGGCFRVHLACVTHAAIAIERLADSLTSLL